MTRVHGETTVAPPAARASMWTRQEPGAAAIALDRDALCTRRRNRWRALSLSLVIAAIASAAVGSAQAQASPRARLQGTFTMAGLVTVARHVPGEQAGQHVTRTWTFTPACPAGPCTTVQVVRTRINGSDTVVLHLRPGGFYAGGGIFYVPLGCAGRRYPHGEQVPFKLTVRVTGKTFVNGTVIATRLAATYRNRARKNLTPCVAVLGHDAARYGGTLVSA
jgi:hypothetical protein